VASHPGILIRLLTWNLFHGRDRPPGGRPRSWRSLLLRRPELGATHAQVNVPLRREFAATLAGWEWDVALLQEAPPRWLRGLEQATGANGELALTSRNSLPWLRARLAEWSPDLIASNEGGSNMVLARPPARIVASERVVLAIAPERRVLLMTRLAAPDPRPLPDRGALAGGSASPSGRALVVACTHLSVPATGNGTAEALRAAEVASEWAGDDPLVLGGDLNLRPARQSEAFATLRERYGLMPPTAPHSLDHLLARGVEVVRPPTALAPAARDVPGPAGLAIRLSDHAPVLAEFRLR
jgi:endonuclease/exonuclease/phosphatase family metal-dependent hydrolase